MALGAWPDISLADARKRRDVARLKVLDGIDPTLERKRKKRLARMNAGNSFMSVAEDFIKVRMEESGKAESTIRKARWYVSLLEDAFKVAKRGVDLVYLDPPYVPRADDNCYIKRYHFLEGLSCYWQGLDIDYSTKVRKIPKRYTPFSYRREATEAFERLFRHFKDQKIVLSYSSNGYPDLDRLIDLLSKTKSDVRVFQRDHTYHFGTHAKVKRAAVQEYLIVGQ